MNNTFKDDNYPKLKFEIWTKSQTDQKLKIKRTQIIKRESVKAPVQHKMSVTLGESIFHQKMKPTDVIRGGWINKRNGELSKPVNPITFEKFNKTRGYNDLSYMQNDVLTH